VSRLTSSSPQASRRMAKVRQKGTDVELSLRREMYRLGLRYRIDYQVLEKPRRVADIAFPGRRIAIFVDGCFWHGCPRHATWPKQNAKFWREKIETNQRRDADTNERLRAVGWTVLRFWSHESAADTALIVAHLVAQVDTGPLASSARANDENLHGRRRSRGQPK
jgi:DNA mismatch endonuclease (patch repair protein)